MISRGEARKDEAGSSRLLGRGSRLSLLVFVISEISVIIVSFHKTILCRIEGRRTDP